MTKRIYLYAISLSRFYVAARFAALLLFAFFTFGATTYVHADTTFTATLNGAQVVPATNSAANGIGSVILKDTEDKVIVTLNLNVLPNSPYVAQIRGAAEYGANAPVIFTLTAGVATQTFHVTPGQVAELKAGLWYFNVTTTAFPGGEIRGQIEPVCVPSPSGLSAHYRGENNINNETDTGDGTAPNGISYPNGKAGKAFGFNGTNQFLNLGKAFDYRTFTISMWIKPGAAQVAFATIADNNRTQNSSWNIQQNHAVANQYNYFDNGGGVNFDLQPDVWQHLTIVRSPNMIVVYINGLMYNFWSNAAPMNYDGTQNLLLGRFANLNNESTNRNWNGQIDEFTVFNRALTQAEIFNIYNAQTGGICTNDVQMPERTNGRLLFFRIFNHHISQIYTANSDGSNPVNLSNNSTNSEFHPSFSPDHSKIAFSRWWKLYMMNSDGTNARPLIPNSIEDGSFPRWSPDGSKILFTQNTNNEAEICVINSDGTNFQRLTNNSIYDTGAQWSPDGSKIVFTRRNEQSAFKLFTMSPDGSNVTQLTDGGTDSSASWSPDGKTILFTRNNDIHAMNSDGTGIVNLTNTPSTSEYEPQWSPDGKKVLFTRIEGSNRTIWVMKPNGNGQTVLVADGYNALPSWESVPNNRNVTVSPADRVNVTFPEIHQFGGTVAVPLSPKQLPKLPHGFIPGSMAYEIRTSAVFSNYAVVSITLTEITNEAECSNFRVFHFKGGVWNDNNNLNPVFNGVCSVSQYTDSFSPFIVGRIDTSSQKITVSGRIIYGVPTAQNSTMVSNAALNVQGSSFTSALSALNGAYQIEDLVQNGHYTITASKTGFINGISPFDATLILRCAAAGNGCTLTENQRLAADADGDGITTPFDATQILRFIASGGVQSASTGAVGTWRFRPFLLNYSSLSDSMTDQNFTAILIGEVSGDWSALPNNSLAAGQQEPVPAVQTEDFTSAILTDTAINRDEITNERDENVTSKNKISASTYARLSLLTKSSRFENGVLLVPVLLNNNQTISGYVLDVEFDPNLLKPDSNKPFESVGTISANSFTVVSDTATPGRIGIAASSGNDLITTSGILINLRFNVLASAKTASSQTGLTLSRAVLEINK